MPSVKEAIERFKHDFPEEYARQEKLVQEIVNGIPKMDTPRFFGRDRDSWGIKRWIHVIHSETDHGIICPQCRTEYSFPRRPTWGDYQYCPHCGQWLGEPEKRRVKE